MVESKHLRIDLTSTVQALGVTPQFDNTTQKIE